MCFQKAKKMKTSMVYHHDEIKICYLDFNYLSNIIQNNFKDASNRLKKMMTLYQNYLLNIRFNVARKLLCITNDEINMFKIYILKLEINLQKILILFYNRL